MFIPRTLTKQLEKYYGSKEIIAVVGPRQSGKTTLLKKFLESKEDVCHITFEDERAKRLFQEDIDIFIGKYVEPYKTLFIDELQYAEKAGKKLKYIYDTQDTKLIVSGSSAIDITINSLSYLAGRILHFELYPLSFHEVIKYKHNISSYNFGQATVNMLNKDLDDFILYGSYPAVKIRKEEDEKQKVLNSLFQTLVKRDIRRYFDVKDDSFIKLMEYLSLHNARLLNDSKVSRNTNISRKKVKDHITILEKAYIVKRIKPFYKNKKKEVVKHPEIFFIDTGLKNAIMKTYAKNQLYEGYNYESYVFSELIKYGHSPHFWRSKNKAEVDIVVRKQDQPIPIEVKTNLKSNKVGKSLHSFINRYSPEKAFILSRTHEDKKIVKGTPVHFLPLVKTKKVSDMIKKNP